MIRIFGKTGRGQNTCVNVHGYLPYFYVEYPHELLDGQDENQYMLDFARALEQAYCSLNNEKGNL